MTRKIAMTHALRNALFALSVLLLTGLTYSQELTATHGSLYGKLNERLQPRVASAFAKRPISPTLATTQSRKQIPLFVL